ncbi:S8 family serine peptidase [Streptomyces zhihengii]|uniref:S8 family serine peptidase n=1 Tax=Streptomyces zhihengii TaxID=1818004 RepID=A0ABS2UYA6_9ACTN|nr:S8 family serine peptidase [Streptomyces zhihengii]MBM9622489.1 S8 family serine peptidase [Streptomyces zhihengii]
MTRTDGSGAVPIGVLDGPVAALRADRLAAAVEPVPREPGAGSGPVRDSAALRHGTAVAGVLGAARGSGAPGVCPGCPLLLRPVFTEDRFWTSASELARGIDECRLRGARLINVSAAFATATATATAAAASAELTEALDLAGRHGVVVVAAGGQRGRVASSPLVSHPAVLPVVPGDLGGQPLPRADLSPSAGRRGLLAPGAPLSSLAPDGGLREFGGSSLAAALVTGALALVWSLAPGLPSAHLLWAARGAGRPRRRLVPPLLDAHRLVEEVI